MSEDRIIELSRIERQLILYVYFSSPRIKEKGEIQRWYGIPQSTMYKDLKDLRDAGLISVKYDSMLNEYVDDESESKYESEKDTKPRRKHLDRLNRLVRCLHELSNDEMDYDYETTDFIKGKVSCKDRYVEMFPEVSARTMERDFNVLTNIGYPMRYNRETQQYDFYDDSNSDMDDLGRVYGVFYDKEQRKLCRKCGDGYDYEIQRNYLEEIRGKRLGLPLEEWEPY